MTIKANTIHKHAASFEIENIINKWIEPTDVSKSYPRLSLLPAQTGSGKSYSVAKIMGERSISSFPHTLIYVVHTKPNLRHQYEDLLKLTPEAKQTSLLLQEDAKMLIDFFQNGSIKEFESYEEYQKLKNIVNVAIMHKKHTESSEDNQYMMDYMTLYRDNINKEKKALQERLSKEYKQCKFHEKKHFMDLVSSLFPTANLSRHKAIFLTTQKFMYPLWTLSGTSFLYEMEEFKDAKLFIDEFDAQKNQMLDIFTKETANALIDKVKFFLNTRHVLKESTFLGKYNIDHRHAQSVKAQFEKVYKKHVKGFSFVYREEAETVRYILRSEAISSLESAKNPLSIRRDEVNQINWVESGDDYSFTNMLGEIDSAIRRLAGLGKRVVKIHKQNLYEKKIADGVNEWIDWVHERDSIMRQFIGEFNLNSTDTNYRYLQQLILHRLEDEHYSLLPSQREEFYDNGFSLIHMEETDIDTKRSNFNFYSLNKTPENFLVKVASHMHIIGISATIGIETVIKNFDLTYLKTKLTVDILSNKEIETLNRLYIQGKKQDEREFHVDFINEDTLTIKSLVSLCFNKDIKAKQELDSTFRHLDNYHQERYMRLLYLYWQFISNENIKSFLVLLNAYPSNDGTIKKDILIRLYSMMILTNKDTGKLKKSILNFISSKQEKKEPFREKELFFIAGSDDKSKEIFQESIQEKRLKEGGSSFVISVYQAMGAGRNIQYYLEKDNNPREKDYDAIYCEKPTHLLVRSLDNDNPIASLLKLLYQLHALHTSYSVPKSEFREYLKKAMTFHEDAWKSISYSKGEDYDNAIMIVIIQAIGRLHRTNNPHDSMFIYLDNALRESIQNFNPLGHTLLPSVMKILETAQNRTDTFTDALHFNQTVQTKSIHMLGKIRQLLKSFSNEKTVEKYENIKEHILQYPTMPTLDHPYYGLYTPKTPKGTTIYWYKEEDDYKKIDISPVKRNDFIEVSSQAARLDVLSYLPELKQCLQKNNINTSFTHTHLLTPVVFNNLYKGALGEVIGKYILETYCGIVLNPISVESGFYEFFDFISDKNIAIDFKYYSRYRIETTAEDNIRLGNTGAIAKRKEMGIDLAVIVNIFYMGGTKNVSKEISIQNGVAIVPFIIDASNRNAPILDTMMLSKIRELFQC